MRGPMKNIDKTKITYFALGAFLAVLFLFFSYSRVFDEFEYSTLDLRYRARPPQSVDKDIVIIEIGDDSIEKLGKWPFPRDYHALIIKALKSAGVKTVIFDVFFSEKKEGDEELAAAVGEAGNVYLPYVFELDRDNPDKTRVYASGYLAPLIDVLKKSFKGTGFINAVPDMDGKIRDIPPFIEYEGVFYPHLSVLAALNDLGYEFDQCRIIPGKKMTGGKDLVIPLDGDSSMLVDYPAVWGKAFRHYSYVDVLQSYLADVTGQEPTLELNELKDTICFIGLTAAATPDTHPSPMEPLYPGIGVHASVYNSVINKTFLRRLNRWWNLLILIVMWMLTAFVTARSRKRFAFLSIFLIMAVYVLLAAAFFWPLGIWMDVFYPLVSIGAVYVIFTFKKYITETQKRELLEKELTIARDIQQSFLPREVPRVGALEVSVKMATARQVGGDLYDMIRFGDNKLGVMMGDVAGKGVPAALFMAKVVSVFKSFAKAGAVAEGLRNVNDRLIAEGSSSVFVTLTYMVLDTEANSLEMAIGGHLPTILVEPDGNIELLDVAEGMPLGLIESDFSECKRDYKPGSVFVLYTDGVTEAMNLRKEMFGEDRLVELIGNLKGRSAEEIVDAIHEAVVKFAGKASQHDDITVMAVRT